MKTLKVLFSLAVVALLTSCGGEGEGHDHSTEPNNNAPEQTESVETTYNIDAAKSKVNWEGTMLKMYSHTGTVDITDGSISVKDGQVTGGEFTIDMSTMATTDSNYDEEERTSANLIGHLSSPDFFDVANHPTANFVITDTKSGVIKGDLTIRDKTESVFIEELTVMEDEGSVTAGGTITFNRQNFDVSYQASMADMVLSDDVECVIKVYATK